MVLSVESCLPLLVPCLRERGDTVAHVFRLLCPGHVECRQDGVVGWRFEDLQNLAVTMQVLFDQQNSLYERLGLSEDMNQRVRRDCPNS